MIALPATVRCLRVGLVLLMVTALSGCFFWRGRSDSCKSVEEYQSAPTAPQISVPTGLDKPDESAGLKVPDGPAPAEPLSKTADCLQRPPNYFEKAPPPAGK